MSSFLTSPTSSRRRLAGLATFSLLIALAISAKVQAQVPPPVAAPAGTTAAPASTSTPAATAPAPATGAAGAAAAAGNIGGRRNARGAAGAFGAAGNAGAAGGPAAAGNFGGRRNAAGAPVTPNGTGRGFGGPNAAATGTGTSIVSSEVTGAGVTIVPAAGPGALPINVVGQVLPGADQTGATPVAPPVAGVNNLPDPNALMHVNMPGSSGQEVFEWLQRNTGKIILQEQQLPTVKITFSTDIGAPLRDQNNNLYYPGMPRAKVVDAIINLLSMNDIILVPMGNDTLRAVAADVGVGAVNRGVPMLPDDSIGTLPPNENYYSELFHLHYITSGEAFNAISNFGGPRGASITQFAKDNTIVITDNYENIQRDAEMLKHVDIPVTPMEDIIYIPMRNAKASDVVTRFTGLAQANGPFSKYFGTSTAFTSDDRTNSLIVVTNKSNTAMVNELAKSFDSDVDPTTTSEEFFMKQADYTNVTTVLKAVVTGSQTAATNARGGAGAAPAGATNATRDSSQFSQYVTIVADPRTNGVVAYGTPSDLKQISALIDKLDRVLPQVHLDVIVTEVTLTKDQVSGLSSFGIDYNYLPGTGTTPGTIGGGKNYDVSGPSTNGGNGPPAFTLSGSLTQFDLNTVLNASRTNTNVKVLSNPSITVMHAQTANISVGETVPIINSTTTQTVSSTNAVTNTITPTKIAIQLFIRQILVGKDGTVTMQIEQDVDDIVSTTLVNGVSQPIIGTRTVASTLTVKDGQVLVMGGLRSSNINNSHGFMYFLGDIPIIGQLFQPDTYDSTTRELIVFIKPTILNGDTDAAAMVKKLGANSPATDMTLKYFRDGVLGADDQPAQKSAPAPQQNAAGNGFTK